jgi:MFS family permease
MKDATDVRAPDTRSADKRADRSAFVVLFALVLAEVVSAAESTMIFAALRVFYKQFGDPVMVGWIVTAFLLVAAASASVCARLGDMYGRRRMLLAVLAVSCAGSLVSAVSTSIEGIIAGRAIQGFAGAVMPLCFGLVRETLPPARVQFGVGVVSAAAFVFGGLALFAGGVIVDHLSWNWIFYAGAATAVVAWFAVLSCVPRSSGVMREPVDVLGAVLLVPSITGLLLALSQATFWGWDDVRTLLVTAGCLLVLAIWTLHELRSKAPLIDVRLLGKRQLALANLGVVLLALGPLQSGIVLSLLLQQPPWTGVGLGLSATVAGLILAPPLMLAVFVGPGCGALASRYGARVPAVLACVLQFIGWSAIVLNHDSVPFVAAMVVVQGIGMAMAYAAAPMLIVEVAPQDRTSEVTGVSSVIRYVFMAVGSQVVTVLLAQSTVSNPLYGPGTYPAPSTFALTLSIIAALCLVSLATTLALPRRRDVGRSHEPRGQAVALRSAAR